MKMHIASASILGCLIAIVIPCAAQDAAQANAWNGSWKADPSSMKFDGATASMLVTPDGYTLTREGKSNKVVCDGKPNPPMNGTVTTCTKTATGYDLANTRDGKPISNATLTMSPDGATLTRVSKVTPPDIDPYTVTIVSKKVSGGDGAPTVWKESSFSESQDTGILSIAVKGDSIDFKETDADKPFTCKLDGTPMTMGKRSMAVKLADPNTLKVTYSYDGKVTRENTFKLSQDGSSIEETDVTSSPGVSTMTLMFHKS